MLGKLLQPRPPALLPLELQAGELDARFTLDWCTRPKLRFDAKGTLQARDATLGWDRARVEAVQTRLQLDGLYPLQGRIQLSAPRGVLATGTALADLNVDLALATKALTVHALDVALLGGTLHSAPQSLPWPSAEQAMPLEIRHIDLGQLLALFKVNGLSGSGQDGVVPLTYRNGSVEIHDGQVNSVGGGTIKYAPVTTIPDNPGLLALRNFHFQQLGMHLWYGSDGTYRTQVKLDGSNPDFYSGYPISFGLNINGALPGLFRAALFRATSTVTFWNNCNQANWNNFVKLPDTPFRSNSMFRLSPLLSLATLALLAGACSPTVRLEAPDKPIEINMTVNIKHEILVKVEKEVQQLFDSNKGLF